MRHRKAKYKLGMRTSQREAMLRNMVTSLLEHESITTTDARAKSAQKRGRQDDHVGEKRAICMQDAKPWK